MSWAEVKAGQVIKVNVGNRAVTVNGRHHPASIFRLWTGEDLKSLGFYPYRVVKEQSDSRFYKDGGTSYSISDDETEVIGTIAAKEKSIDDLKEMYHNQVNNTAYSLLHPTDWEVVKASELGTSISDDLKTFRTDVRSKCNELQTSIAACTSFDDLKVILDTPEVDEGEKSIDSPISDWPEHDIYNPKMELE